MTERDYKKEYRDYHSKPENMADRVKRNLWNRRLKGKVPAGKEIDHKNALASGGSNDKSNIRYRDISENRGDKSMLKSAFLQGLGSHVAVSANTGLANSLSDRIANKILGEQVYVNGVNTKLKKPKTVKTASIEYRGEHFDGYNKPKQAPAGDDHKMVVLAKKGDDVKLIRFGKRGYEHNYSKDAKQNYLTRSAGIRDKNGNLTKDDKLSANYWARKTLWPK
ncbi:MAG: hypothetical protein RLY61_311, partial [Candidatus Parcubacteria bacterium]